LNLQPPGLARFGHLRRTPGKATVTVSVLLAEAEPLQNAVCPAETKLVEQPSPSVRVRVAV
jgi:hypothetical protein